ncbi:hypothetical protein E2C01_063853 [Portunus trituberculatus]|uniref:Uncharacterized protein n=1 Tax=Portunus trituberculatus TaxID=210409 RepID=A0A5B7HHJ0_PORTR|nr:hypothetical protein [Portunus trituberculatus]
MKENAKHLITASSIAPLPRDTMHQLSHVPSRLRSPVNITSLSLLLNLHLPSLNSSLHRPVSSTLWPPDYQYALTPRPSSLDTMFDTSQQTLLAST